MIRNKIRASFDAEPTRTRLPIPEPFSELRARPRTRRWFILMLQTILLPIAASRSSNLLATVAALFAVVIGEAKYSTFMAPVKLPWTRARAVLWRAIPDTLTDGRLLPVLDEAINSMTGTKVFACQRSVDHAAKTNQSRFEWVQTFVKVGLLKVIHGRWRSPSNCARRSWCCAVCASAVGHSPSRASSHTRCGSSRPARRFFARPRCR